MAGAYPELARARGRDRARHRGSRRSASSRRSSAGCRLSRSSAEKDAISGEDAFTLAATYGFPLELTVELAEERGQPVDVDGYTARWSATARSRAAGSSEQQRAAEFAREAGFETEFVGYAKTDVLTQIGALEELEDGHFLAKLRESPFYPAGGGQVTDQGTIELDDESGARAELVEAYRFEDDQALLFRGTGLRRGRPRARRRAVDRALPDDGEPHGDAPPAPGAARRCSASTSAGRVGGPADKLRFDFTHDDALDPERARRGRAARQREGLRERSGARLRDADRRGAQARGDDAVRREVRRHRPRRRGPRLSIELCGGTHVASTAEIGPFVIL